MSYRTLMVIDSPNNVMFKVISYSFLPSCGRGILVCYKDGSENEILYSFKTTENIRRDRNENCFPDFPDKEIRNIKYKKIIARYRYVSDTSAIKPNVTLNVVDSIVCNNIAPLFKVIKWVTAYGTYADNIYIPRMKGYVIDTSKIYYPVLYPKSFFKRTRIK